jgi:hypothetical protein
MQSMANQGIRLWTPVEFSSLYQGILVHGRNMNVILNSGLYGFAITIRSLLQKIIEHENQIKVELPHIWLQPEAGDQRIELELASLYLGAERFGRHGATKKCTRRKLCLIF